MYNYNKCSISGGSRHREEKDMEIYKDEKRTLLVVNGTLKASTNSNINIPLATASTSLQIPPEYKSALKKQNVNPDDYFVVYLFKGGRVGGCFPLGAKPAVDKAISDYVAEIEAARNDPARIARNKVFEMFEKARRRYDYPGEYYPLLKAAEKALEEWLLAYPEAAKEEKKRQLLSEAEELKAKAVGALVYDADGWLTAEDKQKRHDEWIEEAKAKIAEANAL